MKILEQIELFPPTSDEITKNASQARRLKEEPATTRLAEPPRAPYTQGVLWEEKEKKYTLKPSFWNEGVYYIQDKIGYSPENSGAVYKPWWSGLPCQEMWYFDLLARGCDLEDLSKPWLVEGYPLKH